MYVCTQTFYIHIFVLHACMHAWMDGWMDGRMDGWMGGWMGGRMYGWIDVCLSVARVYMCAYMYVYMCINIPQYPIVRRYMYIYIYHYISISHNIQFPTIPHMYLCRISKFPLSDLLHRWDTALRRSRALSSRPGCARASTFQETRLAEVQEGK